MKDQNIAITLKPNVNTFQKVTKHRQKNSFYKKFCNIFKNIFNYILK